MPDQAAAAPPAAGNGRAGMRRLALPLESYEHPSSPLSAKRLVNLYAEQEPNDARSAAALIATPGLALLTIAGTGPVAALNGDMPGHLYVASGTHLYRLGRTAQEGGTEDLGDIGTPLPTGGAPWQRDTMVTIAVSPVGAVVCVPPKAFTCTHTGALNEIGGAFPGASSVAQIDGYFVFTASEISSRFFLSRLFDPTNYDGLDFAYADTVPNVIRRVIAYRGDVWLCGEVGLEAWYDTGDADFPFRRRPGVLISLGVATPRSVVAGDGSIWFLGMDGNVYRTQGYQAVRISTHGIEALIQGVGLGVGDTSLALDAMFYTQAGHSFYCLSFPNNTICYDCNTKLWHERASDAAGTGRWRASAVSANVVYPIFGDSLTGALMTTRFGIGNDMGVVQRRIATLPPLWAGTERAFCSRLEVEMQVGEEAMPTQVLLDWTDDGARSWTGSRTLALTPGAAVWPYRQRAVATRLGSFRQRTFRLTASGELTVYAVDADITTGNA